MFSRGTCNDFSLTSSDEEKVIQTVAPTKNILIDDATSESQFSVCLTEEDLKLGLEKIKLKEPVVMKKKTRRLSKRIEKLQIDDNLIDDSVL